MLELELENRFYTRAEISEATGIPVDADQFSRNVKRRFSNIPVFPISFIDFIFFTLNRH